MKISELETGCLCGHFEKCTYCENIDWTSRDYSKDVWATDGRIKWKCSPEHAKSHGWKIIEGNNEN